MKLNLGSYTTSIKGFTNVDLQKLPNVEIISDVSKLTFAENESVEEIVASHVLEHFSYYDVDSVIAEWNRVLKIGGILYISVPDILKIIEFINQYGWGVWMERMIFGDQDYEWAHHKAGFTEETLREKLERLGFDNIRRVETFPFEIEGKTASTMQFPDSINQGKDSAYISLTLIARKNLNIKGEVEHGYKD